MRRGLAVGYYYSALAGLLFLFMLVPRVGAARTELSPAPDSSPVKVVESLVLNNPSGASSIINDVSAPMRSMPSIAPKDETAAGGALAIDILNTYPNLVNIKNKLNEITCKNRSDQSVGSGLTLVTQFLTTYDGHDTSANLQMFSLLDNNYDCETAVIKSNWDKGVRTSIKYYLMEATHHLWLESSGITPWSLKTYSASEIDALFRNNKIAEAEAIVTGPSVRARGNYPIPGLDPALYDSENSGIYVPALEKEVFAKLFPLAEKFIVSDQRKVIDDILGWNMRNFFHAVDEWGWDRYADGRSPSDCGWICDPLSIERLFEERISGCHQASFVFSNMLRMLNIPAIDIGEGPSGYGVVHSVTYLPTLQRFVHGDHIADIGAMMPFGRMLITLQDFIGIATYNIGDPPPYLAYMVAMGSHLLELERNGKYLRLVGKTYLPCDNKDEIIKNFTEFAREYAPFSIVDSNMNNALCSPGKIFFNLKSQDVPILLPAQLPITPTPIHYNVYVPLMLREHAGGW